MRASWSSSRSTRRTPHVVHFDGADAGKVVTYWLRWVSTRDDKGPWSAAVAATVTG